MHLMIHVLTTPAMVEDVSHTSEKQKSLIRGGLAPHQHLVDAGYVDAGLFAEVASEVSNSSAHHDPTPAGLNPNASKLRGSGGTVKVSR